MSGLARGGTPPGESVRLKRHKPPLSAFKVMKSGQVTGSEAIGGAIALPYR